MAGNFLKYGADEADVRQEDGRRPAGRSHQLIALCAPRPCFISYGIPERGDPHWVDARGSFMAGVLAGPVYRLLGKKDLGTPGDYLTDKMPPVNKLIGGELAWRQHDGGHDQRPTSRRSSNGRRGTSPPRRRQRPRCRRRRPTPTPQKAAGRPRISRWGCSEFWVPLACRQCRSANSLGDSHWRHASGTRIPGKFQPLGGNAFDSMASTSTLPNVALNTKAFFSWIPVATARGMRSFAA